MTKKIKMYYYLIALGNTLKKVRTFLWWEFSVQVIHRFQRLKQILYNSSILRVIKYIKYTIWGLVLFLVLITRTDFCQIISLSKSVFSGSSASFCFLS